MPECQTAIRIERVEVDEIFIPKGRRPLDDGKVASLAESLQRLGLLNPIIVHAEGGRIRLVAGHHRLAAALSLGWSEIDAMFIDGDDVRIRLAEIAENLHRAELSRLERAELESEWIRLLDKVAARAANYGPRKKRTYCRTNQPKNCRTGRAKTWK